MRSYQTLDGAVVLGVVETLVSVRTTGLFPSDLRERLSIGKLRNRLIDGMYCKALEDEFSDCWTRKSYMTGGRGI